MVCRDFILPEICKPCLLLSTFQFAKLIVPYPQKRRRPEGRLCGIYCNRFKTENIDFNLPFQNKRQLREQLPFVLGSGRRRRPPLPGIKMRSGNQFRLRSHPDRSTLNGVPIVVMENPHGGISR